MFFFLFRVRYTWTVRITLNKIKHTVFNNNLIPNEASIYYSEQDVSTTITNVSNRSQDKLVF